MKKQFVSLVLTLLVLCSTVVMPIPVTRSTENFNPLYIEVCDDNIPVVSRASLREPIRPK